MFETETEKHARLDKQKQCKRASRIRKKQKEIENKKKYLKEFDISKNGKLHEQSWAKSNMEKFHNSVKDTTPMFNMQRCMAIKIYFQTQLCVLEVFKGQTFNQKIFQSQKGAIASATTVAKPDSNRRNAHCTCIANHASIYQTRGAKRLFRTLH